MSYGRRARKCADCRRLIRTAHRLLPDKRNRCSECHRRFADATRRRIEAQRAAAKAQGSLF